MDKAFQTSKVSDEVPGIEYDVKFVLPLNRILRSKFLTSLAAVMVVPALGILGSAYCYVFEATYALNFRIPLGMIRIGIGEFVASMAIPLVYFLSLAAMLDLARRIGGFRSISPLFWYLLGPLLIIFFVIASILEVFWGALQFLLVFSIAFIAGGEFVRPRSFLKLPRQTIGVPLFISGAMAVLGISLWVGNVIDTETFPSFFAPIVATASLWWLGCIDNSKKALVIRHAVNIPLTASELAWIVIGPFLLAFACGHHFAKSKVHYHQLAGDHAFILVAIYGDNCVFAEYQYDTKKGSNVLTGNVRLMPVASSPPVLEYKKVGPLIRLTAEQLEAESLDDDKSHRR